ncbi:MAG: MBL fold metallo-hydrolase [Comamonadaceae bacterium]|nr:MAG: MBL fold metallo-hydrolase [Comamonadaceae bacterium]
MIAVHHLNCISSCPLGGRMMDGRSPSVLQRGSLCCHCLLLETDHGLVLVDTGFGLRDVHDPRSRLSGFFLRLLAPDFREEMTAVRQVQRLGFRAGDVRHIVLTHLDFDHAGGLDDFPHAQVHLMQRERDAAQAQRTWLDRQRFRPQQWSSRKRWHVYGTRTGGAPWYGFDCVRDLRGLPPEILMVPLPGHTLGHAGVAVRGPGGWTLMAGDAYFHHREMDAESPWCTPGLRLYQCLMEKDRRARLYNQQRLRALTQRSSGEIEVLCAHDPGEFERIAGRPAGMPQPA